VAKIGAYRKECQDIADDGYEGFTLAPGVAGASAQASVKPR